MTDKPDVTELLNRLTQSESRVAEFETKIKSYESSIAEKDKMLGEKDEEITKLQSILAKNFIASRDSPKNDIKQTSFAEAYAQAIKENAKE